MTSVDKMGIVTADHALGIDLTIFANNPKNKIDQTAMGSMSMEFSKELFFVNTSNLVLHKANAPVTIVT